MKKVASSVWLYVLGFIVAIAVVTYVFALIFNGIQGMRLERAQEQAKKDQELQQSGEKHQISMQGAKQKQTIEAMKAVQDMKLKEKMAKSQAKQMKGGQNADNKNRKRSDE